MTISMGQKFREAMKLEKPLQIVGAANAYMAIMAKDAGFRALYLSGAGVANISYGLPDIGITSFDNVFIDAFRIVSAVDIPLIVDIDTGFGNEYSIKLAVNALERIGVAGIHIEDQTFDKKCGHLEGKKIVETAEMCLRLKACCSARQNKDFVIIARTDAMAAEGMEKTIKRALSYKEAGADIIFAEAFTTLDQYTLFKNAVNMPILANITEFGKTPLFTITELKDVDLVLYPLSASRAMNLAALNVYRDIRENGTQKKSVTHMQTREELYQFLKYEG